MTRYIIVFLLLTAYAVFFAPGAANNEDPYLIQLVTGQFHEVDPLVTAVFASLGIYPVIFALLLLPNDRYWLPAWPFVLISFGLGAFSILPYLAFRGERKRDTPRGPGFLQQALQNRLFYILILLLGLLTWLTALAGSWGAFTSAFTASHFVSVMSIDLLVVLWLTYDILRRDWNIRPVWPALLPVLGPVLLLLWHTFSRRQKRAA
ncbi:hypothetical protein [Alkalicoccus chagannorensis]|uniref:hypothetical protein n=1 Tax=Alkalicoccus chagannorensis TaxID=427072 RepID=UPI0003F535E7|nr:hypothetical protein [Alkalicoccus chagannorensis]